MLVWFSCAIALAAVAAAIEVISGGFRITNLLAVHPLEDGPLVSVIVAARNEERGIDAGVRSLLGLRYRPLELIVVNDRSTDGTGVVLKRLQHEDPRLLVVNVADLPAGWLGKNHALALGAARARGDLLLFTDADVVFEPSVLGRAVRVLEDEELDHVTALPDVRVQGVALTTLVTAFGVLFALYSRPWKARDPKSRSHIGVGAFNLIRAIAYERIGTHAALALRPDDDMRLGRAVKQAGLRQDVVQAGSLLEIEWYQSAGEMVDGLMKNAFAGLNYSVLMLVAATAALVAFNIWPWIAVVRTGGAVRIASMVTIAAICSMVLAQTRRSRVSAGYVLLYPFGVLGFIYIMWRSAALALSRGAIRWRDTSYSLESLRRAAPAQPLERTSPR